MGPISAWFGGLFEGILPAFQNPLFAYQIAIIGFAIALILIAIAIYGWAQTGNLLSKRYRLIEKLLASNLDSPRVAFAANWQEIDGAMLGGASAPKSSAAKRLRTAWEEFRETLVDLDKPEIRNTQRPQEYFDAAVRSPTWLDFFANMFVGAGLLLTFIGLVAALKEAAGGVDANNTEATQRALTHLLAVASTKFVTSIVGVGLSIALKLVDRFLEHRLRTSVSRLSALLERGFHHISPQGLAVEQLDELRQQSKQLKSFATELAVAIGDRLNQSMSQALAPVVGSLEKLTGSIEKSQTEQMQALRDGAGRAIDGAASQELRALSEVLGGVSTTLASMQTSVSASGDAAAQQIAGAAAKFEGVADGMRTTFDDLARRISALGAEAAEQGKAQQEAARGQLESFVKNIAEAGERQGSILRGSATELSEASSKAVINMAQATESAATRIGEAAGAAMSQAGDRIAGSLDGVVARAEKTGEAFGRIDATLGRNAESLGALADRTTAAADAMRTAVQSLAQATVTTQQTTALLREVVIQFEKGAISAKQALDQTGALVAQIETHQKRVNETWAEYRKHFEGVDAHLGAAMQKWSDHHKDALDRLNQHVVGIDSSMGAAVSKLNDTVQPLSELAEALNERRPS